MNILQAAVVATSVVAATAFTVAKIPVRNPSSTARMMSASADFIKSEIASNDVVVFSKSYCPFCKKTKNLFLDLNIKAQVFELNEMDNGEEIQNELLELTGQRTVPNVFIKGNHLGGNDDTQAAAKSGKLNEMLN